MRTIIFLLLLPFLLSGCQSGGGAPVGGGIQPMMFNPMQPASSELEPMIGEPLEVNYL